MYIKEATIYGFIPFDTFGIKSISINAESIVQILIGSNGSGKSCLLRELNPLPSIKSMYHKNGGKELLILHKEDIFKISSTFTKSGGKHSFMINDGELNTDGTAPLQVELAEKYLGYTATIHNFILGKYDFVNLRPSERKSLLMSISLAMPEFMIDMHKYSKSKLREYKNNLNLLYTRKQEIENKLDKDLIIKLKSDKIVLDKSYTEINNKIYYIEKLISDISSTVSNNVYDNDFINSYFNKIKNIKKSSIKFRVDNNDLFSLNLDTDISEFEKEYTTLEFKLNSILKEGKEVASTIEKLDENINKLKNGKEIDTVLKELEIKNTYIQDIRNKLGNYINNKPLNSNELIIAENNKDKIFDELSPFLECREIGDFVTKEDLFKIKDNLSSIVVKLQYIENKINSLENINKQLKENINKIPKDPDRLLDTCNICEYRKIFKSNRDEIINNLTKNNEELKQLYIEQKDLNKQKTSMYEKYEKLTFNFNILSLAYDIINSEPFIYNPDKKSFLEIGNEIKQDISKFLCKIDWLYNIQNDIIKYHEILKEISDINIKVKSMKESNLPNIEILEKLQNENKLKREVLLKEFNQTKKELTDIKYKLYILNQYKNKKTELENELNTVKDIRESYIRSKFLKHLKEECLVELNKEKKSIDDKLFIINAQLKEQESLQERYDKEIMIMIKELEKRKDVYKYIEYSLSPETGLVHYNLIKFVNSLIKNVNFVISRIWTSKLEMIELQDNDDFSCNFMVNCNGNIVKIENLSKGQTKVMNFAWYIALQIALDTKDYPVFFDECDENLDKKHKERYIEWLKTYIDEGYASQMWLVNHDAALYTGFLYKDIICLNNNNITNISNANVNTEIKYN